jgi:hypothetical protein
MKEILEKLVSIEKEISREKGNFSLFALFLREDSEDKWDLVVSAPWLKKNKKKAYEYLASIIKNNFQVDELTIISRIVLLDKGNPVLDSINNAISAEHSQVEVKDCNFFGLQIKHAYIITSKREDGIPKVKAKGVIPLQK